MPVSWDSITAGPCDITALRIVTSRPREAGWNLGWRLPAPLLMRCTRAAGAGAYIIETRNHGTAGVGRDVKELLPPTPLPWAGIPPAESACPELPLAWP